MNFGARLPNKIDQDIKSWYTTIQDYFSNVEEFQMAQVSKSQHILNRIMLIILNMAMNILSDMASVLESFSAGNDDTYAVIIQKSLMLCCHLVTALTNLRILQTWQSLRKSIPRPR